MRLSINSPPSPATPPFLPSNGESSPLRGQQRRRGPMVGLLLALGICAAARLIMQWHLPIPQCGLRRLTGWPCPLCGGTRTLDALTRGHWAEGLALNPLIACAMVVLVAALLLATFGVRLQPVGARNGSAPIPTQVWIGIGLGLTLINWGYLCLHLPP